MMASACEASSAGVAAALAPRRDQRLRLVGRPVPHDELVPDILQMGRNRRPHATQTCNADAHLDAPLGEVWISLAQPDTAVMPARHGVRPQRGGACDILARSQGV